GLEFDFDEAVLQARVVLQTNRISGLAGLLENIRFAGRGLVPLDAPLGFAYAGLGGCPAGWSGAGDSIVEVHGLSQRRAGQQGCAHEHRNYSFHDSSDSSVTGLRLGVCRAGLSSLQGGFHRAREVLSRSSSPVVEGHCPWLLV